MLQICSGKLFQEDVEYKNQLRGIIYTNLRFDRESAINTDAGSLLPTSYLGSSNTLIYELEELIESSGHGAQPGVLISHGVDPYLLDFSAVLSFALNCTASVDNTLTDRLLSDKRGVSTFSTPKKMVKRVFDREIYCTESDEKLLIDFTKQLIGLERRTYLGVMRAIRTYVTGMHRISDDFVLAYTLLVASIESLTQDFDGHKPSWLDYDQRKRGLIDSALSEASNETAEKVRSTLLDIEHTALSRRFKEFSLKYIKPSFYREEVQDIPNPITSVDLPKALNFAYQARSQYIHNLKELPRQLTLVNHHTDTYRIGNQTLLTIQGLSRLARHVITEFIMQQTTVKHENYDYLYERAGVTSFRSDPRYWVGIPTIDSNSGSKKLEGFLSQLASQMAGVSNSMVTDLTDLLTVLESNVDRLKKGDKLPYIALYFIFNHLVPENQKMTNADKFILRFRKELFNPTPEALIFNLLCKSTANWNIEVHYECLKTYFKERDNKLKFRIPKLFEAGLILLLAERYRLEGNLSKTRDLIAMAVENYPDHVKLRQFEIDFSLNSQSIEWMSILLSSQDENSVI